MILQYNYPYALQHNKQNTFIYINPQINKKISAHKSYHLSDQQAFLTLAGQPEKLHRFLLSLSICFPGGRTGCEWGKSCEHLSPGQLPVGNKLIISKLSVCLSVVSQAFWLKISKCLCDIETIRESEGHENEWRTTIKTQTKTHKISGIQMISEGVGEWKMAFLHPFRCFGWARN